MTLLSDTEPGGPLNKTADTRLTAGKRRYGRQARDILPGLFLTSIVAGAAFAIRQLPGMALFSPMILSIMIGIAYHNIVGKAAWAKQGVTFSLRRLLRIAIILLGPQLTASQVMQIGGSALPCKLERPEDYSAASCSEQPSTAIPPGVSSIDLVDWKDENNELDCSNGDSYVEQHHQRSTTDEWRKPMRRDIEFNAEGLTLRGWSYVPDGAKKMKYFLAALLLVSSLAMSATVQARTNESGVRPQADRIYGREVAAPPWSAACMTDQGPSVCGEPMWVYSARGGHAGKKNALSPEVDAPHRNGGDKPHVDWPANMILG